MNNNLIESFGNIDIYLFDQLLKGRFDNSKRILDVGCGGGRNIVYFLKNDFDVFGIDTDATAIEAVKTMAHQLAPNAPPPPGKFCNSKSRRHTIRRRNF